jgi:hypothetical protein
MPLYLVDTKRVVADLDSFNEELGQAEKRTLWKARPEHIIKSHFPLCRFLITPVPHMTCTQIVCHSSIYQKFLDYGGCPTLCPHHNPSHAYKRLKRYMHLFCFLEHALLGGELTMWTEVGGMLTMWTEPECC